MISASFLERKLPPRGELQIDAKNSKFWKFQYEITDYVFNLSDSLEGPRIFIQNLKSKSSSWVYLQKAAEVHHLLNEWMNYALTLNNLW